MKTSLLLLLPALLLGSCEESENTAGLTQESVLKDFDAANPVASRAAIQRGNSSSSLKFEIDEIDLGDVRQQTKYPLAFPFAIDGDDELAITGLQPSCGCTDVALEVNGEDWPLGRPIPGKAKGKVTAIFDSQNARHRKNSRIVVMSNAVNKRVVLELTAYIHPIFEFSPSQVRFNNVAQGETPELDIRIRGVEPFQVQQWKETEIGKVLDIREVGEPEAAPKGGGQFRTFRVKVKVDAAEGMHYGSFVAATDLDGHDLEIFATINVLGPVQIIPEHRLGFGIVPTDSPVVRTLKIHATRENDMLPKPNVELVPAQNGGEEEKFVAKLIEVEAGRKYEVQLRLGKGLITGRHDAVLKVAFPGREEEIPARQIPVTAIVRGS